MGTPIPVRWHLMYPFPNFNGSNEIWEWMNYFIPHFTGHVISVLRFRLNHICEGGPRKLIWTLLRCFMFHQSLWYADGVMTGCSDHKLWPISFTLTHNRHIAWQPLCHYFYNMCHYSSYNWRLWRLQWIYSVFWPIGWVILKHTVYPKKYAHGFCFAVVIHWLIFPYPSGLLHGHCGNLTIAPVPAKQPWWIWINTSCEFIMNDCITTTKQSTTKPSAYFLGYTVHYIPKSVHVGCPGFGLINTNIQYIPRNMHTVVLCFALLWLCNRS